MKTFLAIVGYLFLTLFAAVGGIWIAKEPIALKVVCPAMKSRVSPDECVKEVAVRLSKPSLCDQITGADFKYENPPKQECLTDIAVATNDIALCEKVEGGFVSQTQFSCTYKVAIKNENAAACMALEGSESRIGIVQDQASCLKAIGKTEADAASAPPKKGPAPLVAGLSVATLDLAAYGLIGLWALAIVVGIVMKAMGKKEDEAEEEPKAAAQKQ